MMESGLKIFYCCVILFLLESSVTAAWNHDVLHKVYDKRLFEVHEVQEDVSSIVDAHHSRVLLQQEDSIIPIIGCGPTIEYHKKREEVMKFATFADIATVLHADDESCMIAHAKLSHLQNFNE